MKKFLIMVALATATIGAFATESTNVSSSESEATATSEVSVNIVYDGNAYSAAQDGLIPTADGSVSVYWTNEECTVNGRSGYTPYSISGGTFTMRVNGKTKNMTHYVNYQGERYFFCI